MAIQPLERYHGSVLSRLVRKPVTNLKLFEREKRHNVNRYDFDCAESGSISMFIKWRSSPHAKKRKHAYQFTFNENDIANIRSIKSHPVLVSLVCGNDEICILNKDELKELGVLGATSQQSIIVSWSKNKSFKITHQGKPLSHTVAKNRLERHDWFKT